MTRVQVLWQTGAVSDFTVPRKDRFTARATPPDAIEAIRRLRADGKTDTEIATELDRRGLRTGMDRPWSAKAVIWVRQRHGIHRPEATPASIRQPDRRADGLYSVRGVAAHLGVTVHIVRYWVAADHLRPVEGGGPGRAAWFQLDGETVERLKQAKSRGYGPRRNS